ncbi:MAG: phosphotransferase [Anaerolineales bacterium]|jgi:aminoglycoside phosphotransferase (APT) family kinase protein
MVDLLKRVNKVEQYLADTLSAGVEILEISMLKKSSREAPWRVDVLVNGQPKAFVFRIHTKTSAREYKILKAIEGIPIRTPKVYGLDKKGKYFGRPCFFMDFLEGDSLLKPLLAGEDWAEELYIDSAIRLFTIPPEYLEELPSWVGRDNAEDLLDEAYQNLKPYDDLVARRVYQELKMTLPKLPEIRFSNGDLYPENMIIRDQKLAGVIDFANANFSDPLFEFLLPMFIHPQLKGRGLEGRFCERMGIDPDGLPWYNVLEFYDLWGYLAGTQDEFAGYNASKIREILQRWLNNGTLKQD